MRHTTPNRDTCSNEGIAQTLRGQIYPRPQRNDGYEGNRHWCPECKREFTVEERRIMDDAQCGPLAIWGDNEWLILI